MGSVAKCHPVSASSSESIDITALLFGHKCPAWWDLIQIPSALSYRLIQNGVLVHAGDHLDQHLAVRETNKVKQLVPTVRSLEMPWFFVPLWDQIRQQKQSLNQPHIHDVLCDNTRSHRLETSRISSQNAFTPSKIYAVCVSRCAFLSLKMMRRWRNFCTSGWNKSNSRYKWFPMERRRNSWLPTSITIS
jgi:hypothetical protein